MNVESRFPQRVALYARVSTPGQDLEPQFVRLREWAKRAGLDVHMERSDVASGRLVRRPGAEEIMAAARGHHVHGIAVAKVDRWARSMKHLSSTVDELHGLGVDFHAIDQGLHVRKNDPTSKLILGVLSSVAEWEASIISERTKDALRGKAPGMGAGRHKKGCGVDFPCPTGSKHEKGMPLPSESEVLETGGLANDRLIQPERSEIEGEKRAFPVLLADGATAERPDSGSLPVDGASKEVPDG